MHYLIIIINVIINLNVNEFNHGHFTIPVDQWHHSSSSGQRDRLSQRSAQEDGLPWAPDRR